MSARRQGCAACHATGGRLTGDERTTWKVICSKCREALEKDPEKFKLWEIAKTLEGLNSDVE